METEQFEVKKYIQTMNISNARMMFSLRTFMYEAKFNYKHQKEHEEQLWRCDSCERCIETQSHILSCPAYVTLREDMDLNKDEDLVRYFKKVMEIRNLMSLTK